MGWIKTTARTKPHRCRRPRITRRHGNGSAWQCDTCNTVWEIHRPRNDAHWSRYNHFCFICGPKPTENWPTPKPATAEPIESPDQPEPIEPGTTAGQ
jgi:hypothetical protein